MPESGTEPRNGVTPSQQPPRELSYTSTALPQQLPGCCSPFQGSRTATVSLAAKSWPHCGRNEQLPPLGRAEAVGGLETRRQLQLQLLACNPSSILLLLQVTPIHTQCSPLVELSQTVWGCSPPHPSTPSPPRAEGLGGIKYLSKPQRASTERIGFPSSPAHPSPLCVCQALRQAPINK